MMIEIVHLKKGSYDWTFCGLNCEWGFNRKISTHLEEVTCRKCMKAWGSPLRIKGAVTRLYPVQIQGGQDMVLVRREDLEFITTKFVPEMGDVNEWLQEYYKREDHLKAALETLSPPREPDHLPEKG